MMQRPVLNPMFVEDHDEDHAAPAARPAWLRLAWAACRRTLSLLVAVVCFDLFFWRPRSKVRDETRNPWRRFVRGLALRLALAPVVLACVVFAIVWGATHPAHIDPAQDPQSLGLYFDPVTFAAADGAKLEGWLTNIIDEQVVLREQDVALRRTHPAVVLVHDFGYTRHQVMQLIRPLHDAGFNVLAVTTRGCGQGTYQASTFGAAEAADVAAAVDVLRRRPFVAPAHIAVVGLGTGGTAALLAAQRDPKIAAVVLDHPPLSLDEVLARHMAPKLPGLGWTGPLCRWTFQVLHHVDPDQFDVARQIAAYGPRPLLVFDERSPARSVLSGAGQVQLIAFLRAHITPKAPTVRPNSVIRALGSAN